MNPISQRQAAEFDDTGFVIIEDILDNAQVATALAASDRIQRGEYTADRRPIGLQKPLGHFGRDSSIRWYLNARVVDEAFWQVATDPVLGEAAARLLRATSVSLVEDQLLDKPGPGLPCNFHQDYGYWLFSSSTQMVSCWIALIDMTLDMGPLELIPRSHRWGHVSNPRELIAGSEDSWMEAVECARPPGVVPRPVTVCVPAGGGVFFHSLTFHGSARNRTGARRRAFSLHWAGDECRVNRSRLVDYAYPYMFSGVQNGSRVVSKYMPIVYAQPGSAVDDGSE